MTLLEKVLMIQALIQTPILIWLCFDNAAVWRAVRQLHLRVFYKPEDKND